MLYLFGSGKMYHYFWSPESAWQAITIFHALTIASLKNMGKCTVLLVFYLSACVRAQKPTKFSSPD